MPLTQRGKAISASYREDYEVTDLIVYLLTLHVPDCLDRRRVLDYFTHGHLHFIKPVVQCPKCQGEMVCPDCDDIEVDVDATVTIGGRTIHV